MTVTSEEYTPFDGEPCMFCRAPVSSRVEELRFELQLSVGGTVLYIIHHRCAPAFAGVNKLLRRRVRAAWLDEQGKVRSFR